jgi:hypothetical protein
MGLFLFASLCVLCGKAIAAEPPDFAKHVFPLFQEHCLDCHGKQDPEGGLVMEDHAALMKGGDNGAAIVPGNSADSLLVKFLEGRSGREGKNQFMPPGKKKHLEAPEIALIRAWIDAGAKPSAGAVGGIASLKIPKIAPQPGLVRPIQSLAVSPDGRVIAVGRHGAVELLDAATRAAVRTLDGVQGGVSALVFSADGAQLFAAAGDPGLIGEVRHWNVADGKLVRTWEAHPDAIYALALSADGQMLATASYDQRVKVWNPATGELRRELKGHNGAVFGVSFRRDGRVLASASADRTVKLWDPQTGARLDTFSQPTKEVYAVAFHPAGRYVVAGGADNRIRLWQVSDKGIEGSNKLLYSRVAHEGAVLKLAFAADGHSLLSSAADQTVKVWNPAELTERIVLEKQPEWAPAVSLANGGRCVIGRLDGSLAVYDATTGELVAPAAKKAALIPAANRNGVFAQTAPPKKAAPTKATTTKAAMDKKAAPSSAPSLARVEPGGVQRGAKAELTLTGKNLKGMTALKFSDPKVTGDVVSVNEAGDSAVVRVQTDAASARTVIDFWGVTASGETGKLKLHIDDLPQLSTATRTGKSGPMPIESLPAGVWGVLRATGQQDDFAFDARAGQTLVFDLEARRLQSKATAPSLQLLDEAGVIIASNYGMENNTDPLLVHRVARAGRYVIRVSEVTLEGSADHVYRLTLGELPYVTGFYPLSAATNREVNVTLAGYNLPTRSVRVTTGAAGKARLPLEMPLRFRGAPELMVTDGVELADVPERGRLPVPASVNGRLLNSPNTFTFPAQRGQTLVLETLAARAGSPADTKIEVLFPNGEPVPRLKFQAVRDSWINFRKQEANNPGVRIANWEEMDLNQFLWFNGDIQRVFRMPRGPDADMIFFSNGGKRRAWFDTTATAHALDDPCYVVEPRALDAKIVPNGLPVFTLHYANDDDGDRELGADSRLLFTAPADGDYLVRVSDTRGMGGERFAYRLTVRPAQPDFAVALNAMRLNVGAGAGSSFGLKLDRVDGFDGPVKVEFSNVPEGFRIASPVVIEPGHLSGESTLFAAETATNAMAAWKALKITASATIGGRTVTHAVKPFDAVVVGAKPAFQLALEPGSEEVLKHPAAIAPEQPLVLTIPPGGTVPAMLRVVRHGNTNLINLDLDGLPFGIIVDNIGLNGVQIRPGENEREIFLAAAPWVPEQEAMCFAVTQSARNDSVGTPGTQTSFPVLIRVRKGAMTSLEAR